MASLPAVLPDLPYVGKIEGGLRNGTMIRINGNMDRQTDGSGSFTINFLCEPITRPLGDVPFSMDVQIKLRALVYNIHTFRTGWGVGKKSDDCPIKYGQDYEILILVHKAYYKIVVNGIIYRKFSHRLVMSHVRYFHLHGDTNVSSIHIDRDVDVEKIGIPQRGSLSMGPIPHFGHITPPSSYIPHFPPTFGRGAPPSLSYNTHLTTPGRPFSYSSAKSPDCSSDSDAS